MRRKKHRWQQVLIFDATDKQAKQAYSETGPNRDLTADQVRLAYVVCSVCEGLYPDVGRSFCPGSPTIEAPAP